MVVGLEVTVRVRVVVVVMVVGVVVESIGGGVVEVVESNAGREVVVKDMVEGWVGVCRWGGNPEV